MMRTLRHGFALPVTILVMLAVAAMAGAAAFTTMSSTLIDSAYARDERLGRIADLALEETRAVLNGLPSIYPDTGYIALEENAPVTDASGALVPGMTRSVYVGPVGITSGQFGVHGAIIAVTRDAGGGVAVRRGSIVQESFAKYAYFTDVEPDNIAFGGNDQLFGPVHSNDDLRIYSTGATFFGPVTTSGTIIDRRYGSFREGYTERAGRIPLPEVAELDKLRGQASAGGTAFTGGMTAASGRATTRIEFAARDLNGDGDVSDDHEGFIRVYQSNDTEWLIGANDDNDMRDSETCGHWHADGRFYVADDHPNFGADRWTNALSSGARCFLGGADQIGNGFRANDGRGAWIPRGVAPPPAFSAQPDAGYLFPITRALNPSFKGVIHVTGDVAISGVLRGRVTVAASGDIIIADDITYAINPGVGSCDDILGLFAGGNIVVANTPLNAPWPRSSGSTPITFDDTSDEHIHAFLLTLGIFTVQDYAGGPDREEWCEASRHGRGCLYLTGGIIQRTRGAVGTSGGTGYVKRYSYDACGERQPPPYFPTTGKFSRGAYLEVDPTNFDIGAYFGMLTAGGQ